MTIRSETQYTNPSTELHFVRCEAFAVGMQ